MSYPHGPYHPHAGGPAPTHIYYNRGYMRGGPSRLIWFGLGGLTTYWFVKSREHRREIAYQNEDGQKAKSCAWGEGWGGWGSWGDHQRKMREMQHKMEEEQHKMRGFGTSASEAIVDLTEASLDSVMTSVIALKSKLAEQRAANDAARAAAEKEVPRQV